MNPRVALLLLLPLGCSNYRDQLERADEHYRGARYESALVNLEDLEPDLSHLNHAEQIRYEYIRGMTHARLAQRTNARHWLARAREDSEGDAVTLSEDMRTLMTRTLHEVDWVTNPPSAAPTGDAGAAVPPSNPSR